MKKMISMLPRVLLAVALFAPGLTLSSRAAAPQITLRFAELYNEDNPMYQLDILFAEKVFERSGGRIKINIYGNGQLGDEKASYQALQMGSIDFFRGNTATLSDFGVKKINTFTIPYIFRDREHLWKVLESDVGREVLDELRELDTGMVGLYFEEEGARNFFTNKPVASFKDLQGLKIRVPQTQMMMNTVAAIGANPTPISYAELYSALSAGTVDGAENPLVGYLSLKFYEPAPYMILDEHTFNPIIIIASQRTWDRLSPEDQAMMLECGAEVSAKCKEEAAQIDERTIRDLKALGVTIVPVPDKTPFQEATKGVLAQYSQGLEDFVARIQKLQ